MRKKIYRVIIDTNLWITFLISKDFSKLEEIIFLNNAILVFSEELVDEFEEVARRKKFRRFFPFEDTEKFIKIIDEFGDMV